MLDHLEDLLDNKIEDVISDASHNVHRDNAEAIIDALCDHANR